MPDDPTKLAVTLTVNGDTSTVPVRAGQNAAVFNLLRYVSFFIFLVMLATRSLCYVSPFTMQTFCFADGRCLFQQARSVIYYWIGGGWVYHLFIYLRWSYRMVGLSLCCHSIAPSTCKDDISASAICHL